MTNVATLVTKKGLFEKGVEEFRKYMPPVGHCQHAESVRLDGSRTR